LHVCIAHWGTQRSVWGLYLVAGLVRMGWLNTEGDERQFLVHASIGYVVLLFVGGVESCVPFVKADKSLTSPAAAPLVSTHRLVIPSWVSPLTNM
jgi:hypothetical protein